MMENKKSIWLIRTAGILFIISALGQGFCAIPQIKDAIKGLTHYWSNRIYMYCWLVNLSMWTAAILVLYGASALNRARNYSIIIIPALYAFIMAVLILFFTPSDWWHSIFMFIGVILILFSLIFIR
jgi:hypothetical protein